MSVSLKMLYFILNKSSDGESGLLISLITATISVNQSKSIFFRTRRKMVFFKE
jgi:hypothetical protein